MAKRKKAKRKKVLGKKTRKKAKKSKVARSTLKAAASKRRRTTRVGRPTGAIDPVVQSNVVTFFRSQYDDPAITAQTDVRGSRDAESWLAVLPRIHEENWMTGVTIEEDEWLTVATCRQIARLISDLRRG